MELIKITERDGKQGVDARELHDFLEVGKDFSTWVKARIDKYGFSEGVDFSPVLGKSGGRPLIDYFISLDMAKELAMVERNDQGKRARLYFIECEKSLRKSFSGDDEIIARGYELMMGKVAALEAKAVEDAPKVEFHDTVIASDTVCQMAVACQVADLGIGRNTLYQKLRMDHVLISKGNRHNLPLQKYINQGLFTVKENRLEHPKTGEPMITFTTYVTQKGIEWLIRKYGKAAA